MMTEANQSENMADSGAGLLARLQRIPAFASLTEDQVAPFEQARRRELAPDDLLLEQNQVTDKFWILLEGALRLSVADPTGYEQTVHMLEEGSTFGETTLLAKIPCTVNMRAVVACRLLELSEDQFWTVMTQAPAVRRAILGDMAMRLQKIQSTAFQQEKMAALGTMAAGLMHELNNPGTAARRAASQLRENLMRLHELTGRFVGTELTAAQRSCIFEMQEHALHAEGKPMGSIEQSDAEEALAEWMETAAIPEAWKLAPTLAAVGIDAHELECARSSFAPAVFAEALSWLEAIVSSMALVGTVEESIGRVSELVKAVKSYAYEGRGETKAIDLNASIHATLTILGHKLREKQIRIAKDFAPDLPPLRTRCQGVNQIWTNLLDNAIDAAPQSGVVGVRTWFEAPAAPQMPAAPDSDDLTLCIMVSDNGGGIPLETQPHIFDPFYTTKPVGVGTGLGLGIVHRILEQCGGSIHFTSMPGETEFVVRLPGKRA